jgi:cell wall-associated NlpC family hydrolase
MDARAKRQNTRRAIGAALAMLSIAVVVLPSSSFAAPSAEDVESARQELQALEHEFEAAVERYNEARYQLSENETSLAAARDSMDLEQRAAESALGQLEERAVDAYTGMGSQFGSILEADSFTEFSDRLEFMGAISASDAQLATEAESARQRAEWAAERYADEVQESREHLEAMSAARAEIERMVDEQEALVADVQADYQAALAAQRAAAAEAAAAEAAAASSVAAGTPSSGGDTSSGGGGYVPPVNGSQASIAVQAAYSIVGTRYVWGSSDPSVGLDCSGVTVYAWRQAGVSLPHSAAAQYANYPRIPLSAVQPGDLVYYGNFGPHIGIYVGGGNIIHASSPAPGGQARIDSMYGYDDPWGAVRVS